MVDATDRIQENGEMDGITVRPNRTWLAWIVVVPVMIGVFAVLNLIVAPREVHETKVRTRHILIACDHRDLAASTAALERIREIKTRLDNGEDFAELARQYSDDVRSATKGGDIGYFTRDELAGEYATAAFALKEGEVSDIVKSRYGYHIIQLIDRIDPLGAAE